MQKPFDLQKALAGAPVVTRDGRRVIGLVLLPAKGEFPLAGVIEGAENIEMWKRTGVFLNSSTYRSDLFLDVPVVQKTVYTSVYKRGDVDSSCRELSCSFALGTLNFPTLEKLKEFENLSRKVHFSADFPDPVGVATITYEVTE